MSLFVFAIFILLLNITVFKLSKGISGNILLSSVIVFLLVPFVFRFSSQWILKTDPNADVGAGFAGAIFGFVTLANAIVIFIIGLFTKKTD
ncbi:hypothetical protein P9597_25840 [Aneurinibacillus migulanus]|uniref:hypothetical protein n=1 Tax=Aneurinibacillus migulanus TaxID=47500 RepID=UPI002E1C34BF|nr:hypothetical protein [Aneurinibacillus migulanus]